MLSPFKILGQFWEIDEQGEPTTGTNNFGVLEWDPSKKVKSLMLFNDDENALEEMMHDRETSFVSVCLHGVSIQNLDDGKMGSTRFSIDAFRSGGSSSHAMSAGYSQVTNHYQINGIWSGDTSINLRSTKYTQMGFSFKGLEKWLRHIPDLKFRDFGTKSIHIDTFEMDILRDMRIPNVGQLRLLCGHHNYGDLLFDQSLQVHHQWQIDFSRPKTYQQCQKIIHAIWDCINISIGAVVPLKYVVLTKGDRDIEQPERFAVRIPYTTSDTEGTRALDVLGYRREYIPFPLTSDALWKKWMKAALDTNDMEFSDWVTLITATYRIDRMAQQYELLTFIVAVENMVKRMRPDPTKKGFPEIQLREIVESHTPGIFPEGILDVKVEGQLGLLKWVIKNRNSKIAHLGTPGATKTYNLPAGIYAENVLRLLAMSFLMLEYKLLRPNEIRKFFWESYRTQDELNQTPDKYSYNSIFADGS